MIQRRRIRESIAKVDPQNTALRWGANVPCSMAKFTVAFRWPPLFDKMENCHTWIYRWILETNCFSTMSLKNNLAETVFDLFLAAVQRDGNLWPSRIRVDKGVENVLVCDDAMVQARGHGRGSFTAGPSTRNQRIERLWRDVFRCVCHLYYYIFHAMEYSGVLDVTDTRHPFTLHLI